MTARGHGEPHVGHLLLAPFLRFPTVCNLALATAEGRSTALQAFDCILEVGDRGQGRVSGQRAAAARYVTACSVLSAAHTRLDALQAEAGGKDLGGEFTTVELADQLWFYLNNMAADGTQETALTLARAGALARLVRWARDHCSRPYPQVISCGAASKAITHPGQLFPHMAAVFLQLTGLPHAV